METASPAEIAQRNIALLIAARGLSNGRLAQRMRTLGYSWNRKTVARVLKGERRIHVDEIYAIAVCLETTATILIAPIDRGGMARSGETPSIEVGWLPPILPASARGLFSDDPTDILAIPPVAVLWVSDTELPLWQMDKKYGQPEMVRIMRTQLEAADVVVPEDADEQTVIDLWSELGGSE